MLVTLSQAHQCPGLYPHPSDCSLFYQCDSYRSYEFSCPAGTLFDSDLGLCNHEYLVTCHPSQTSTTTTTSSSVIYPQPSTTSTLSTSVSYPQSSTTMSSTI